MAGDEGPMAAELRRVEPEYGGEGQSIEALLASGRHREALAASARAHALPLGRVCMGVNGSAGEGQSIEALLASGRHREALAASARAYALPLGRLCMAFTGSQAESEELVQETLLAAFDAFPQYRGEGT